MKLRIALEIAEGCGLHTLEEAITNIERHVMGVFIYSEIDKELTELTKDLADYILPNDDRMFKDITIKEAHKILESHECNKTTR